jgi:hypothetical protein
MSPPPCISNTTHSAATRDETGAATAMKRDILHSVDAAGFLESAPDACSSWTNRAELSRCPNVFGIASSSFENGTPNPPMDCGSRPGAVRPK